VRFNYGDKEKLLFDYLEKNQQITLDEFTNIAGISRYTASRTLVLLVLASVLEITPSEKGDLYTIKEEQLTKNN
jgi:predicted HTH transcriptional regulator